MVFHVTDRCNLNCSHCFKPSSKTPLSDELSLEEINRISASLGHIKYLTLAGGEPMLRDDLSEIVNIFYRNNDLHFLNLVTNGWFTDRVLDFVRSLLYQNPGLKISIGVSIDGPEPVHDHIRMQEGSFQKAFETLSAIRRLSLKESPDRLFVLAQIGRAHV